MQRIEFIKIENRVMKLEFIYTLYLIVGDRGLEVSTGTAQY